MSTAIVLGATGLVGKQLVKKLLAHPGFTIVKVLVRRSTGISHPGLEEHVVNFNQPASWQHLVTGDVLFSAFGTTLKKAGSKEAQYKVDYTYQYEVAKAAAVNGVPVYVLVSAAFARPDAGVFYSRIKGELERDVQTLGFTTIHILRPGILAGHRTEKGVGERLGISIARAFSLIPGLGKYKPVKDVDVADAMIQAASRKEPGVYSYTLGEVFRLAEG
jgi:uncharacterized protein YbjT (DUF2867 family)